MRGVLALAAALSIPETLSDGRPLPGRDMILFLTFSVILGTLVLQGVTLPGLIRALGLGRAGEDRSEEEYARSRMTAAARELLDAEPGRDLQMSAQMVEFLAHHQGLRPAMMLDQSIDGDSTGIVPRQAVSLKLLNAQRAVLLELRSQGRINDTVLRKLERDLDLKETQLLDAQQ